MVLYQLIFNFMLRIMCYVMDLQLNEVQKARLSVVVSRLVKEKRFDLDFFNPEEKDKVKLKRKKRRRYVKKRVSKVTPSHVYSTEEIITVDPLDSNELEEMKKISMQHEEEEKKNVEIEYHIDFSSQQSIVDNSVLSSALIDSKALLSYVKHDKVKNSFTLVPEICFHNGLCYEENAFIILLLYLKFNINRSMNSYNNTKLFEIRNNYVIIQKFIFKYLLKNNFELDPYHFKVIGEYEELYPSIEDIELNNISKIDYDEGVELVFDNKYICSCKKVKSICRICSYTANLLDKLFNLEFCSSRLECNHDSCKLGNKIADYLYMIGFQFTSIRCSYHIGLAQFDSQIKDHIRFYISQKFKNKYPYNQIEKDNHGGIIVSNNTMMSSNLVEGIKSKDSFGSVNPVASPFASGKNPNLDFSSFK